MKNLGQILKKIREAKGLSLYNIANDEISTSQLSRFENGYTDRTLIRLPLIPYYNTEIAQDESKQRVEDMGFHRFDKFRYSVKHVGSEQDNNHIEMWSRVLL